MSYSYLNAQPTLVMTQLVLETGIYPSRDGGGGAYIPMGAIRTFAGNFSIGSTSGTEMALGQIESIAQKSALFSLLGTTFGGNGTTNFALPNLDGRIMVGTGQGPGLSNIHLGDGPGTNSLTFNHFQAPNSVGGSGLPFDNRGPELGVTYAIMVEGIYPSNGAPNFMGEVMPFATNFAPSGWMQAAGQLLSIAQNSALFSLLGTTYGGDGVSTFALPDLRGRAVVGVGTGAGDYLGAKVGTESHTITNAELPAVQGGNGAAIENRGPSLELNYLIATQGVYPSRDSGGMTGEDATLGEVIASATSVVPGGWALANGQLLSIAQNSALFSLLGTTYGGDGVTTFALPDLRGRTMVGSSVSSLNQGQVSGSNLSTLVYTNETPTLTGSAGTGFTENGAPAAIATGVTASATDNINFNNGSLTVSLTGGSVAGDAVAIGTTATISVSGSTVSYDADGAGGGAPVVIGTATVNSATSTSVALNANATPNAVKALTEAFTFSNPSENPGAGARTATVTLVDGGGTANSGHDTASFTTSIAVTPVNDAPTVTVPGAAYTHAGALTGISFTDLDGGATEKVTFAVGSGALSATASSGVTLGGTPTALTAIGTIADLNAFIAGNHLSFAGTASTSLTVTINDQGNSDGAAQTASGTVALDLNRPPSVPVDSNGAADSVAEGAAAGTVVGVTAASTDPESSPVTYALTNSANGAFAINGSTGVVTVADPTKIDYEANHSLQVTVSASDGAAASTQTFTIALTDVNDTAPIVSSGGTGAEAENSAIGNVVYQAAASDADTVGTVTYALGGADAALFDLSASGALTFKASPNFEQPADASANNVYDITITANDGVASSAPKAVAITVSNVNEAPKITSDGGGATAAKAVFENGVLATTVVAADPEGTAPAYSLNGGADVSKFTINATTGVLSFQAAPDFEHPADGNLDNVYSVVVRASDGTNTADQTVNVTVGDVNEAPVFTVGANQSVNEDGGAQTVAGFATGIATGVSAEAGQTVAINVTSVTNSSLFSVAPTVAANGTLSYTGAANANGVATVTLVAHDTGGIANGGADTSAPQSFTITVGAVNDAPSFTVGAAQTVLEDAAVQSVAGFITNISAGPANESGQAVNFNVTGNTNAGLFSVAPTISANGTLSYTAAANANGVATITVAAHDDGGTAGGGADTSAPQTFTINVTAVNDAPNLTPDAPAAATYSENAAPTALLASAHVADPDLPANFSGGSIAVQITSGAVAGDQLVLLATSGLTLAGSTLMDGATALGAVAGLGTASVTVTGLTAASTAVEVDKVAQAFGFQSSSDNPGAIDRVVSFTFNDGGHEGGGPLFDTVAQTVHVTPVNDAPVAVADPGAATENGSAVVLSVLANDTDLDIGDTKTLVSATTSAAGATVTVDVAGGTVSYNPGLLFQSLKAGATTTDTFTYTMKDGANVQSTATVTMTITGANDAPVSHADAGAPVAEDGGPVTNTAASLLINDTDVDNGDTKTIVSVHTIAGTLGAVSLVGGDVVYNPGANFQSLKAGDLAVDSFTYTMQDSAGVQSTAQVDMLITGVNDAPTAVADTGSAVEDGGAVTLTIASLLANDTDVDSGDTKTLVSVTNSAAGATVWADRALVYDPGALFQSLKAGATATDTFTYTIQDSAGAQSTATVTMTVTGVNDAPTAVADAASVSEDGPAVLVTAASLLANDLDVDSGDTKTIVSVQTLAGTKGLVSLVGGDVVYNPSGMFEVLDTGQTATDAFTYTMQDSAGVQSTATVTMTIAGVTDYISPPDPPPAPPRFPLVGEDTYAGTNLDDTKAAGAGDDSLNGDAGNDWLDGDTGNDTLFGSGGGDFLRGLDDNDFVDGGAGADTINGNKGDDSVQGGEGPDWVYGGQGSDSVDGGEGDDPYVNGNIGDDIVHGGDGRDSVYGGQNNDIVYGDAGDDQLSGDLGNDLLYGGAGADKFVFGPNSGLDWIGDFNAAEGDRIQISAGTTYTITYLSGQVIINLSDGGVIGLAGVGAFFPEWIVTA